MSRRHWRLLLGLLVGAALLWLATRGVEWGESWRALRSADARWLALALLLQFGSYLLGAGRWRMLFPRPDDQSLGRLLAALLVAQLVNVAFPVRLGPLARAFLLGPRNGQSAALALATVVGEKLLEMLALAAGVALLILWLPLPDWAQQAGLGAVALASIALFSALLLGAQRSGVRRWLTGWVRRLDARLAVSTAGTAALECLAVWLRPGRAVQLTLWTAGIWAWGALINGLVLLAFDLPARPALAAGLLVLLQLGARVPGAPANLGVFESLCVVGLGWFGVEGGLALGYALALHAVVLLPGLVGGAAVLWRDAAARAGVRSAAGEVG